MNADGLHAGGGSAIVLAAARESLPPDWFAIIDGGLHDDLPSLLESAGIRAQPLFLEAGDAAAVASGPFLAPIESAADGERLAALGGRPFVLWSWAAGQGRLYRHLRTLNLALIPSAAIRPPVEGELPAGQESVIFRHWDPIVLAATALVLTPGQTMRLLGESPGIAFLDAGAARFVLPSGEAPAADHGFLSFDGGQIERIKQARGIQAEQAIGRFLADTTPELWTAMPPAGQASFLAHAAATGRAKGLATERALGLWAWLMLNTGGAAATSAEIAAAFATSLDPPDTTMDYLFLGMQQAAEDAAAAGD